MKRQTKSRVAHTNSSLRLDLTSCTTIHKLESLDEIRDILRALLPSEPSSEIEVRAKQRLRSFPLGVRTACFTDEHAQRLCELIIMQLVDHLFSYLTDVATEMLIAEPILLDRHDTPSVAVQDEEVARLAAERLVLSMSLDAVSDCMGRFARLFSLEFEFPSGLLDVAGELTERRRLLAYGHGIVDRRYVERTGSELRIGGKISADRDYMWDSLARMKSFVAAVDDAVCVRFPELQMGDPEVEVIVPRQFPCATDEPAD